MGWRSRIKYFLFEYDIVVWVFAHTAMCPDCEGIWYCDEHQKLIDKMIEEANEY